MDRDCGLFSSSCFSWARRQLQGLRSESRRGDLAKLPHGVPVARRGLLGKHFVQRVELRVRESVRTVKINLFAGVMEPLGSDFHRTERSERRFRRDFPQKSDCNAHIVNSHILEKWIAFKNARHFYI